MRRALKVLLLVAAALIGLFVALVVWEMVNPSSEVRQEQAYRAVVQTDLNRLQADLADQSQDCVGHNVSACEADVQNFHSDVVVFQQDLDAHPAPACLKTADENLRGSLQSLDTASTTLLRAMSSQNPRVFQQAAGPEDDAVNNLNFATTALQSARC